MPEKGRFPIRKVRHADDPKECSFRHPRVNHYTATYNETSGTTSIAVFEQGISVWSNGGLSYLFGPADEYDTNLRAMNAAGHLFGFSPHLTDLYDCGPLPLGAQHPFLKDGNGAPVDFYFRLPEAYRRQIAFLSDAGADINSMGIFFAGRNFSYC